MRNANEEVKEIASIMRECGFSVSCNFNRKKWACLTWRALYPLSESAKDAEMLANSILKRLERVERVEYSVYRCIFEASVRLAKQI